MPGVGSGGGGEGVCVFSFAAAGGKVPPVGASEGTVTDGAGAVAGFSGPMADPGVTGRPAHGVALPFADGGMIAGGKGFPAAPIPGRVAPGGTTDLGRGTFCTGRDPAGAGVCAVRVPDVEPEALPLLQPQLPPLAAPQPPEPHPAEPPEPHPPLLLLPHIQGE